MEASSGEIDSAASGVVRWPVRVETGHYAHPVAPEVYDCVKFLLAREGSGTITGDWGERRFRMGDLMLVGSGLAIGGAPDGTATGTCPLILDTLNPAGRWGKRESRDGKEELHR